MASLHQTQETIQSWFSSVDSEEDTAVEELGSADNGVAEAEVLALIGKAAAMVNLVPEANRIAEVYAQLREPNTPGRDLVIV